MELFTYCNNYYLKANRINNIEELINKKVYIVHPRQGIKEYEIRKIQFTKNTYEWMFVTNTTHRVSELGSSVFFSYEEARKWQLDNLEKYTKKQQERILRKEQETKEKEIAELYRLLEKYPDEESRKLPVKDCSTCKNNVEDPPPHTCDVCTSLDQKEEYGMWEPK